MQRKITTTIEISDQTIAVYVIEMLNNSPIELFTTSANIKNRDVFLSNTLKKVQTKIGGEVKVVEFMIKPSEELRGKIIHITKAIDVDNQKISAKLIAQALSNIEDEATSEAQKYKSKVINIVCYKYETHDKDNEVTTFKEIPLNKVTQKLMISAAITIIPLSIYNFIQEFAANHKVIVNNIWLAPQTIVQNTANLHDFLNDYGPVVIIDVSENNAISTLNINDTTIDFAIHPYGVNNLVSEVTRRFHCQEKEAHEMIDTYSLMKESQQQTSYVSKPTDIVSSSDRAAFKEIFICFMRKMLASIQNFLIRNDIEQTKVLLMGKVWGIQEVNDVITEYQTFTTVRHYRPTTFAEINGNASILGLMNLLQKQNFKGINKQAVVETNPQIVLESTRTRTFKDRKWLTKWWVNHRKNEIKGAKYE